MRKGDNKQLNPGLETPETKFVSQDKQLLIPLSCQDYQETIADDSYGQMAQT